MGQYASASRKLHKKSWRSQQNSEGFDLSTLPTTKRHRTNAGRNDLAHKRHVATARQVPAMLPQLPLLQPRSTNQARGPGNRNPAHNVMRQPCEKMAPRPNRTPQSQLGRPLRRQKKGNVPLRNRTRAHTCVLSHPTPETGGNTHTHQKASQAQARGFKKCSWLGQPRAFGRALCPQKQRTSNKPAHAQAHTHPVR